MSPQNGLCRAYISLWPKRFYFSWSAWLITALCSAGVALAVDGQQQPGKLPNEDSSSHRGVALALARSLPATLEELAIEVLERNPEIERTRHLFAAAAARAPQVRSLPDPVAAFNLFVLPAETRAGPQRLNVALSQTFPWFGTLELRERVALLEAAAARADVEAMRLDAVTEVRRLAYEFAFLGAQERIISTERGALERYEGAAQARYAAGTSLQQGIVRIQAQITRIDTQLLEIAERRSSLRAALNRLRDRPASQELPSLDLPEIDLGPEGPAFDDQALGRSAAARRPNVAAADARLGAAQTSVELAHKASRPDVTLGLTYTAVERRNDATARANRPDDDGDDIVALTGSFSLPVRQRRLEAVVDEAEAGRWATETARRQVLADIEGTIGDLTARLPLLHRHLHLLETVLLAQAREALRSAETAYSTGGLNAVDLLDAEVVLFEVRIAAARTRTDLAIAMAQLERAVARPLNPLGQEPKV